MTAEPLTVHPGPLALTEELLAPYTGMVERVWAKDHTLWRDDPTELADRLGWLDAPTSSADLVEELTALAAAVVADGITDVVVIGMGGSSLFPDVVQRTFPTGTVRLHVLDSTHPEPVRRSLALPEATTLFSVASKSGTTLETRSHLEAAWASRAGMDRPGDQFVAITDPESQLEALAAERGFRACLLADPDVGGRFSALTPFGLGPAALAGVDVAALLAEARDEAERSRSARVQDNPGLQLGIVLAEAARAGRDKVTLWFADELAAFGDWVEQLVAESLGKDGISVVPIVGEAVSDPASVVGQDRVHVVVGDEAAATKLAASGDPVVAMTWDGPTSLGAHVLRWEIATAIAGAGLGLQPFDQPDVASAKAATNEVLDAGLTDVELTDLDAALDEVRPGDLLAVTAFVDPAGPVAQQLPKIQHRLRERTGVAVTIGIGPRYLHSTGQLHKGGSDQVVVLQVVDPDVLDGSVPDIPIPGQSFGFRALLAAQAEGDLAALRSRGRRAHRIAVDQLA